MAKFQSAGSAEEPDDAAAVVLERLMQFQSAGSAEEPDLVAGSFEMFPDISIRWLRGGARPRFGTSFTKDQIFQSAGSAEEPDRCSLPPHRRPKMISIRWLRGGARLGQPREHLGFFLFQSAGSAEEPDLDHRRQADREADFNPLAPRRSQTQNAEQTRNLRRYFNPLAPRRSQTRKRYTVSLKEIIYFNPLAPRRSQT